MVLSCVYRVEQNAPAHYVVDVLRGVSSDKIKQQTHDTLSTFALGKDKTPGYWHDIIRQLVHLGYLQQDISQKSNLKLTQAAHGVLTGKSELMLATPRLQKASYWRRDKSSGQYDLSLIHI